MADERTDGKPRIETLAQLLGTVLAYVVMGAIALVVIDLLFILVGGGNFGRISGWIAAVPSVFVFSDQFRRYIGGSRWAIALTGAALGIGAGIGATVLLPLTWPPLATGGIGGLAAALVYATLWYAGIKTYGEERP
ncbi:hypothetical protein L0U85_10875 [Glycomyces sp. L485]|uniref:hypothetical protein n=1 Tax=Glycomyces sp. L485 TaxID=2909235 RepID=UPI001F4B7AE5|nr:hypothetical protein [Glycomyces sp. L485]MCH7231347.1 hypothetical protein [Glycomyces sp. L485]